MPVALSTRPPACDVATNGANGVRDRLAREPKRSPGLRERHGTPPSATAAEVAASSEGRAMRASRIARSIL